MSYVITLCLSETCPRGVRGYCNCAGKRRVSSLSFKLGLEACRYELSTFRQGVPKGVSYRLRWEAWAIACRYRDARHCQTNERTVSVGGKARKTRFIYRTQRANGGGTVVKLRRKKKHSSCLSRTFGDVTPHRYKDAKGHGTRTCNLTHAETTNIVLGSTDSTTSCKT
jgi:hypothetical protein